MDSRNKHLNINQSWNDSYLINISIIDKEHKGLFNLFDRITLIGKDPTIEIDLLSVISELKDYADNHFKREETLMKKINHGDIEKHIEAHKFFLNKVDEFETAFRYNNLVLLDQMVSFLRKWFVIHILNTDSLYAESVKKYLNDRKNK